MTMRIIDAYPGKVGAADSDFPDGTPRNVSAPAAGDGTPFEEQRYKDFEAFFQGLLDRAGITANGTPDTVQASQLLDALVAEIKSNAGGGAGGGQWSGPDGESPIEDEEFGEKVWKFAAGETQKLVLFIKVPSTYSVGDQIKMKLTKYSPSSNGALTLLLQTSTYLVQKNVDAMGSTTNQEDSTNIAVAPANPNVGQEFEVELTDPSGEINSVAVAVGDILRVELSRGTDTDTDEARFIPSATEVIFG